jgi:hypothetical protein
VFSSLVANHNFWSCTKTPTIECLKWVIESVGEMNFKDYDQELLKRDKIKEAIEDEDHDDQL